jgi:hypothetical protein
MALQVDSGSWPLIQFRNHFTQTAGLLGRMISLLQGLYLNTGQHKHRINAYKHSCFEWSSNPRPQRRAKTDNALDRAATVTGKQAEIAQYND